MPETYCRAQLQFPKHSLITLLFPFRIESTKETLTIEGRMRRTQGNVQFGVLVETLNLLLEV